MGDREPLASGKREREGVRVKSLSVESYHSLLLLLCYLFFYILFVFLCFFLFFLMLKLSFPSCFKNKA